MINIFKSAGARGSQADKEWLWWIDNFFFEKFTAFKEAQYTISDQNSSI